MRQNRTPYLADSGQLDADLAARWAAGEESIESLYLDKSRDGFIYLLSGSGIATTDLSNPDNLARAILSGDIIDEEKNEDWEYGYVHYRTVTEIASLAARLAAIQKGELRRKVNALEGRLLPLRNRPFQRIVLPQGVQNPAEMDGVYPDIIWRRDGEEALQYLLDYFNALYAFCTEAAAQQQAVISFLA